MDLTVKEIDFGDYKAHSFHCMGGLCEIIVETKHFEISRNIFGVVYAEAKRLEKKFSRYEKGNIVDQINTAQGEAVKIDEEIYRILIFADSLFSASNGMFDLTSGVLRKAWTFDGKEHEPDSKLIKQLLQKVGWKKITFTPKTLKMPPQFEIDFGGIVKEYAVDACCEKLKALNRAPVLINFGGDIAVTGPKKNNEPWRIDIDQAEEKILLFQGAVATSGDKNKFVLYQGKKLSHILNPKTGWPVEGAPRSVTVVAPRCSEAGSLSTLALLQGKNAEKFLNAEADEYKVIW